MFHRRNHRINACRGKVLQQRISVIALIGQQSPNIFQTNVRPFMESHDIDPAFFEVSPSVRMAGIIKAAEFHWHFVQGIKAIEAELYIPGALSLLAGIEASIRFSLYQLKAEKFPFEEDLGAVLSNSLLRQALLAGLPVQLLAFPEESQFLEAIKSRKPEVQIVVVRNDLAHGNVQAFVNRDLGDQNAFFTPECLRALAHQLQKISFSWAEGLAQYRVARKA
jgi:hypothetical protein